MHRGPRASDGARAMLRYPIRAACRLLVDRACGCGPLWNQSDEFEPGSGATRAEPYDDVIAQVRLGDARRSVFVSESSSLLHTLFSRRPVSLVCCGSGDGPATAVER